MNPLKVMLAILIVCAGVRGACQQEQTPANASPETVKRMQEQARQLSKLMEQSSKHHGPTFSDPQCRADAQKWTTDPFDKDDPRNLAIGLSLIVNGQERGMLLTTRHLPITQLLDRIYEMSVCEHTDPEFERKYNTYSVMGRQYGEEKCLRYDMFLLTHGLNDRFLKEDAEDNK